MNQFMFADLIQTHRKDKPAQSVIGNDKVVCAVVHRPQIRILEGQCLKVNAFAIKRI